MKPSAVLVAAAASVVGACSSSPSSVGAARAAADVPMASSTHARVTQPNVAPEDASALVDGNTAFAADLYQTLRADSAFAGQNVFFSPYSISLALAMAYAGARGATATQMAEALHFTLPQEKLHPAFDALDLALTSRGKDAKGQDGRAFRLNVANSMWGAPQTAFVPAFLDTIAENYGAGVRLTDFAKDPEGSRTTINAWVDAATEDKIKDLLPRGSIGEATRFVLVNAIYFNAAWDSRFAKEATHPATFHGAAGDVRAQMMTKTMGASYAEGDGYKAVALGYAGGTLSFVAVVPDDFAEFEPAFDGATAKSIAGALARAEVQLSMPKFEIEGSTFSLAKALEARGMKDAFVDGVADFSGMATNEPLHIADVFHKAFVSVDEDGTEAAAATAVVGATSAAPRTQVTLTIDRPFVFFIRDNPTGTIVFLGRVVQI